MQEPETMTTDEQIKARQSPIEVAGSKLSETLMKIREAGGKIPNMDVNGSMYTIKIHWKSDNEQRELI